MRNKNSSENEKFQKIEAMVNELFKCDTFRDLHKFLKGDKNTNDQVCIHKGTIPNFRSGSTEWKFVTSFPKHADDKKMFTNFSNFVVCLRPYCEGLYQVIKTMMEHPDYRYATQLFYTDDRERTNGSFVQK